MPFEQVLWSAVTLTDQNEEAGYAAKADQVANAVGGTVFEVE